MAGSIRADYDLNLGIQDILPFEPARLPGKADLPPTDVSRASMLNALYATRNCEAAIASFLRPAVRNLENLSPGRRNAALRACREAVKDSTDPAVAALSELLREDADRSALLNAFQGLLLAG